MPHALRKSLGPFSAGTRVRVITDNDDGTVQIEVIVADPLDDKSSSYSYEDMVFDTPKSNLVELRPRSENVHTVNRKQRRAFLGNLLGSKT